MMKSLMSDCFQGRCKEKEGWEPDLMNRYSNGKQVAFPENFLERFVMAMFLDLFIFLISKVNVLNEMQ